MDEVALMNSRDRNELFTQTAARIGSTPAVVEKDFWVSWVLKKIFEDEVTAPLFIFKGGTSLSKVFKVIQRFSEDIDLILDWRKLGVEDPLQDRSNTQQARFNEAFLARAHAYVASDILHAMGRLTDGICRCDLGDKPGDIRVHYPASFPDRYLKPEVQLEIGPFSAWLPSESRVIRSYAAEQYPRVFMHPDCRVNVISARMTFWDKATILHHEAYRPEHSPQPKGYSRHYYDLSRLAESPIKDEALRDMALLASVVEYKQRFYPRGWARYDLAKAGSIRLLPQGHVLAAVQNDYRQMRNMFFGHVPELNAILQTLTRLEAEINQTEQFAIINQH
jgi:hypothetical protein